MMSALPLVRAVVIAGGLFAAASLAPEATAQEAVAAPQDNATPRVDFRDPNARLSTGEGAINVSVRGGEARFAGADPSTARSDSNAQPVELQIAADRRHTGAPVDVSFAHRGVIGSDDQRQSHGSEVRVGRGLVAQNDRSHPHGDSVYAFVASDNQALTWRPGARSEFGGSANSVALQDTVNVGDNSAGVTYEHNGVQTSLAYVERNVSTRVGNRGYSQDESFAGVTVTMRH